MNLSMIVKTTGRGETFLTYRTHKGPFSCVCSDMNHQTLRTVESLATLGAGVLLFPLVNFYVCPQVSSLGKSLFTLKAAVWLHSCMDFTVLVQATVPGKGLVTGGAGEGFISCMCPLVNIQGT